MLKCHGTTDTVSDCVVTLYLILPFSFDMPLVFHALICLWDMSVCNRVL